MVSKATYHKDDLEFLPDAEAAARRSGSRFAYLLSLITLLFLVVFVLWAGRAVLDEVTRGDGRVVPSTRVQIVQNLEGGILSQILVREGDIAEKDDVLVRIDNTVAESTYREARSRYLNLLASIARLEAEISGAPIVFPNAVLAEAASAAASQQALHRARQDQMAAQRAVLDAQTKQRRQEIAELQSRRNQIAASLSLAREERAMEAPLVETGISPRVELLRIDRDITNLDGELRTVRLSISRATTALSEAEQRVEELENTSRADASEQLNRQRAEVESLLEILAAGEDRLTRTDVRSPVRGTIKEIKVNTIGGVIQPGQDILEIVPLDDTLLVEARIRPADIAFLRPGQPAVVKITAYDFSIYGGLDAHLEQIGADTIEDERGDRFYRVFLRTEQNTLSYQDDLLPIIPGMTASVEILTGKKTVLDYILKPILKAKERALKER